MKRTTRALGILEEGGYFRKQLERNYHGGETFVTRLYDFDGLVVGGIGVMTFYELEDRLKRRECPSSSTWPTEHVLR